MRAFPIFDHLSPNTRLYQRLRAWQTHGASDCWAVPASDLIRATRRGLIPSGEVDAERARIIHDGTSRNGGVARDKREDRLVSLVYLVYLVWLVEPDRPDEPSPVSLELGIRACSRGFMKNAG